MVPLYIDTYLLEANPRENLRADCSRAIAGSVDKILVRHKARCPSMTTDDHDTKPAPDLLPVLADDRVIPPPLEGATRRKYAEYPSNLARLAQQTRLCQDN